MILAPIKPTASLTIGQAVFRLWQAEANHEIAMYLFQRDDVESELDRIISNEEWEMIKRSDWARYIFPDAMHDSIYENFSEIINNLLPRNDEFEPPDESLEDQFVQLLDAERLIGLLNAEAGLDALNASLLRSGNGIEVQVMNDLGMHVARGEIDHEAPPEI